MPSIDKIAKWSSRSRFAPLNVGLERSISQFEGEFTTYDAKFLAEVSRWCPCIVTAIEQAEFEVPFAVAREEAMSSDSD